MTVCEEEQTHHWQLRQEEIVQEIDIERPSSDELQTLTKACLLKKSMLMPEKHKHHR